MKIFALGLLVVLGVQTLPAADPATALSSQLDELQKKLDHAARRANQPTSGSSHVVGLRGSKVQASASEEPLYWKTAAGQPASIEEIKRFREAVAAIKRNQASEAISQLQSFRVDYPKSPLLPDAEDLLKKLTP